MLGPFIYSSQRLIVTAPNFCAGSSQDLLTTNMAAVEKVVSSASVSFQRTYTNMDKMYTQYRRKAPSVSISNRIIRLNRFQFIHPTDSAQQDQLSLGPSNEL